MGTEYDYERECDEIDEIMATKEQQLTDEVLLICQRNWEEKNWRLPQIIDFVFQEARKETLIEVEKIFDEIKTRNIEDDGLDVETVEYWINEYKIKQQLQELKESRQ